MMASQAIQFLFKQRDKKRRNSLVVQTTIHVHGLSDFNEQTATFTTEFSLFLDWQRRAGMPRTWEPEIVFDNLIDDEVRVISSTETSEQDNQLQKYRVMKRYKGTFVSTELGFLNFPFDSQELIIKLRGNPCTCKGKTYAIELVDERSLIHDADGLRFPLHDPSTGLPLPRTPLGPLNTIGNNIDDGADCLFEWDIGKSVERAWNIEWTGRRTRKREVEEFQNGKMWFSILAYRHPHYQIVNRVLPVSMMVVLCFTSYRLDELADKLDVDLMLLLTITAFKQAAADSQANIPIATVLDKYLLRSFLFIAFICFEQVINDLGYHGLLAGWWLPLFYLVTYHAWFITTTNHCLDMVYKKRDMYSLKTDVYVSSTMEEEEHSPARSMEQWAKQQIPDLVELLWPELLSVLFIILLYSNICVRTIFVGLGILPFFPYLRTAAKTAILFPIKFWIENPCTQRVWAMIPFHKQFSMTAEPPRVLLFDFGAGETKWMLYSLTEHGLVQILEGEETHECDIYQNFTQANARAKNHQNTDWPSAKDAKDPKEINHIGHVRISMKQLLGVLGGKDQLVQWVKDIVEMIKPERVLIGATSWCRAAGTLTVRINLNAAIAELEEYFMFSLPSTSVRLQHMFYGKAEEHNKYGKRLLFEFTELTGSNEAEFEATSVKYACQKATNLKLAPPRYVMSCGGASSQLVDLQSNRNDANKFRSIDRGNNIGSKICAKSLDGYKKWEKNLKKAMHREFPTLHQYTGKVMCISACFYASKAAKIPKEKEMSVSKALDMFTKARDALVKKIDQHFIPGDGAKLVKSNKRFFTNLSNITIQICFLKKCFSPTCPISYHRDWKHPVPGSVNMSYVNFRTTWTAGWYIEMLENHGYQVFDEQQEESD